MNKNISPYKAIVFDCFGVLVSDSLQSFYETFLSDKPEIVNKIKELDRRSTTGELTWDQVIDGIVEMTKIERDEINTFLDRNPVNPQLINYIEQNLKPHYKIGFLSNAADNWLDDLFTKDQQALFDDFVLSYEHRVSKPDRRIFELTAKRLNVAPSECILIDDVPAYCEGARQAGFTAIQFISFEQMKSELETVVV